MPDFSRPEYASYVQLCRELRLKRPMHEMSEPFDSYQKFEGWDQLEAGGIVYSYGLAQDFSASVIREEADPIWLPLLADWLEMLEAAGYDYVRFWPRANPRSWECEAQGINAPIVTTAYSGGSVFGSREEAAARLYVAVTQTPAGPSPPSAAR